MVNEAAEMSWPALVNARSLIAMVWPDNGGPMRDADAALQSWIVPSDQPVARTSPRASKAKLP
jgi:hypothetical protein